MGIKHHLWGKSAAALEYDRAQIPTRILPWDWHQCKARSAPYEIVWDGKNDRGEAAASGVFFYQLEAPGYGHAKKIVILRQKLRRDFPLPSVVSSLISSALC
jgi:hypothetical protein